jgi:hypothetical protein
VSARERCLMAHPHPGRACRDPREVYRNRWGGAPAQPPVEPVEGQIALDDEPSDPGGTMPS